MRDRSPSPNSTGRRHHRYKRERSYSRSRSPSRSPVRRPPRVEMSMEFEKARYLSKIEQYKRVYGNNFDPAKLPRYLHSFEAFAEGKKDFLSIKNGRQYGGPSPSRSLSGRRSPPYSRKNSRSKARSRARSFSSSPPLAISDRQRTVSSSNESQHTHAKAEARSPSPFRYSAAQTSQFDLTNNFINHVPPMTSQPQQDFDALRAQSSVPQSIPQNQFMPSRPAERVPMHIINCDSILLDFQNDETITVPCNPPRDIYFTACFKTLYENISEAWKVLKMEPALEQEISAFSEEQKMFLAREAESGALLACGQSLIRSEKTVHFALNSHYVAICNGLDCAELPIIRGLRIISSQYGSLKCDVSGLRLVPIDHLADVRASIRLATQLLPQAKKIPGEPTPNEFDILPLSNEEAKNIALRSWLPTYHSDGRFYWIVSCCISRLFEKQYGFIISPYKLVKAFRENTFPRWWHTFQTKCLPKAGQNRLNFLFTDWTAEMLLSNLGKDAAGKAVLETLELQWPEPKLEHFFFDLKTGPEVLRLYNALSNHIRLFSKYNMLMPVSDLGPSHLGSWNQMSTVILFQGMKILKAYRATGEAEQSLATRFPPLIFYNDRSN